MKRPKSREPFLYIIIVMLVIIGLICGNLAIRQMFLNYAVQQTEVFVSQVASRNAQYLPDESRKNDFAVYDLTGRLFPMEDSLSVYSQADLTSIFLKYQNEIAAGRSFSFIGKISGLTGRYLLIGSPAMEGSTVKSVVVYLQKTSQLFSVMHTFDLIYGVITAAVILLMALFFRRYYQKTLELEKMQRDYIANVSHELKSPIASIRALSETMLDGVVTEEEKKRKYLSIIFQEAGKLEYMVLNILQLSRLQSEREPIHKERTGGEEIFHDLLLKYSTLCEESDIDLRMAFSTKDVPELYTDPGKITQILGIFLDNALKFVKDSGHISIAMEVKQKKAVFTVTDDGIGIRNEDLPYIFNRFYKGSKEYNAKGSGLGLAIAHEIAELLGEEIEVKSEFGKGSSFSISVTKYRYINS
jgi:signal transduction histidine kinase